MCHHGGLTLKLFTQHIILLCEVYLYRCALVLQFHLALTYVPRMNEVLHLLYAGVQLCPTFCSLFLTVHCTLLLYQVESLSLLYRGGNSNTTIAVHICDTHDRHLPVHVTPVTHRDVHLLGARVTSIFMGHFPFCKVELLPSFSLIFVR